MELLYQGEAFLVVNKPAGIPVLPDGWEPQAPYLTKLLEAKFGKIFIIHRLDKITSGVMVFARDAGTHRSLNMLFDTHAIHKSYHALVVGSPGWETHTARHPLRFNVGHSHRTVVDHRRGKPSETSFGVLERFKSHSLLEALPATGRTHQIRVHAGALGLPLLGDTLYGAPTTELIARPALHAASLEFELDGNRYSFSAPYPTDFHNALEKLRASH